VKATGHVAGAFAAAGWTPVASPAAGEVLALRERELGKAIPAALRELYALDNGVALLREHSNCDWPLGLDELGKPRRWGDELLLPDTVLPFMVENQAVACWGVALDGGDDPAVLVRADDGREPGWRPCCERFSVWLECQVRDAQHFHRCAFAAQANPLSAADVAALRWRYREGPRTGGWPGRDNYRFAGDTTELVLWNSEDQCDLWVAPAPGAALAAVLDDLPAFVFAAGSFYELVNEAKPVLDAWQAARGWR
jgi:hypothetical protein